MRPVGPLKTILPPIYRRTNALYLLLLMNGQSSIRGQGSLVGGGQGQLNRGRREEGYLGRPHKSRSHSIITPRELAEAAFFTSLFHFFFVEDLKKNRLWFLVQAMKNVKHLIIRRLNCRWLINHGVLVRQKSDKRGFWSSVETASQSKDDFAGVSLR